MAGRLEGKTAIIVGAGQTHAPESMGETIGNGRAMAILFAREGAQVMCVDLRLDSAEETVRMIMDEGGPRAGEAFAFPADVTRSADCAAIAGHHMVTYEVSKMAVNRLTTVVAAGNAKHNVRCNAIMPGLMDTPMAITGIAAASGKSAETLRAERNARVPMGRMGSGWDTAYAALFLCSDEARFITGAILPVDGGTSVTVG